MAKTHLFPLQEPPIQLITILKILKSEKLFWFKSSLQIVVKLWQKKSKIEISIIVNYFTQEFTEQLI